MRNKHSGGATYRNAGQVLTLFDVTAEVHDFPTDGRHQKVSDLLLGTVVTGHDDEQGCSLGCTRAAENGRSHKTSVRNAGEQSVQFA